MQNPEHILEQISLLPFFLSMKTKFLQKSKIFLGFLLKFVWEYVTLTV